MACILIITMGEDGDIPIMREVGAIPIMREVKDILIIEIIVSFFIFRKNIG